MLRDGTASGKLRGAAYDPSFMELSSHGSRRDGRTGRGVMPSAQQQVLRKMEIRLPVSGFATLSGTRLDPEPVFLPGPRRRRAEGQSVAIGMMVRTPVCRRIVSFVAVRLPSWNNKSPQTRRVAFIPCVVRSRVHTSSIKSCDKRPAKSRVSREEKKKRRADNWAKSREGKPRLRRLGRSTTQLDTPDCVSIGPIPDVLMAADAGGTKVIKRKKKKRGRRACIIVVESGNRAQL